MQLIEREGTLVALQQHFEKVSSGEGHCILLCGEAGIGKTALVRVFCKQQPNNNNIYQGACDDLFTPRPLAPLYDVLWQVNKERWATPPSHDARLELFTDFFQELRIKDGKLLLVFEDIHWADEATLDFIKFFVRRINQLPCLFILTYRDHEANLNRSLRNALGQLPPDTFTRILLKPLSKGAVVEMATQKGYNGEDVFNVSGGIPFYVNEILASYSPGIPEKIKNAILTVYENQSKSVRNSWEIWSIMPEGLEVEYVSKIKLSTDISNCLALGVLIFQNGKIVFKHELYRRTIEESLTPSKRMELNKRMLELFLSTFEAKGEVERILQYAKNAGEKQLVVKYASEAARRAASAGAHKESAKLWFTAIEYCDECDISQLAIFFEAYSKECYFSSQIKASISFTEKVLDIRKNEAAVDKIIECLCLLSKLWWIEGNGVNALHFAQQGINWAKDQRSSSNAQAFLFSNIAVLRMDSDEQAGCLLRGNHAIEKARAVGNEEAVCRAMIALGTIQMMIPSSTDNGIALLKQSLQTALKNNYFDMAAYIYYSMGSCALRIKKFELAEITLNDGVRYSEERGLNLWNTCMQAWKARLELEKGNWAEAWIMADNLVKNENQPGIIKIVVLNVLARIALRRGDNPTALLQEAKTISFMSLEMQQIIPTITALLEYKWLTGKIVIDCDEIEKATQLILSNGSDLEKSEFVFWMKKADRNVVLQHAIAEQYDVSNDAKITKAATFWEQAGVAYQQALVLFEGNDEAKRNAITIVQNLGANKVYEKLKQEMRDSGIKNIPRGIRNSTRSNDAFLTKREMEILKLLRGELQNKEIAAQLYISAKTVDHRISSILFKLDAHSRYRAVATAIHMGILK